MRPAGIFFAVAYVVAVLCGRPCLAQTEGQAAASIQQIEQQFALPPADARPMVRWWWFGVAVQKPEILRELRQMKADGIGGVELAFVYPQTLDDPATGLRNLAFLSPAMLDAVSYAQQQARQLGLRVDLTLGSGWPYGGPATRLDEAAGHLRLINIPLPARTTGFPMPKLLAGDRVISIAIAAGNTHHWNAATAQTLPANAQIASSPGPRVALVFIASHTRQQVKRAAVGAEGYVLDPFNQQAVASHLRDVGEPLVKAFGMTPPYAVFSDSLEAYGADWTPLLPEQFRRRRGYDLLPHLPELVAGGSPQAEKVRHDYGRTLTELVNENYLAQINEWAHAHRTRFRSQTYGEPAVSFSSQQLVDLPEGEGPQWRSFSTLRWATSANHEFGNNVSSGESFTWLHSPVFRATPLDMKAEADIDFIMGENQFIFHGWPYSPPQAGEPGWSLYAAAVFNDHNPWHPVMPAVTNYITRLSFLLRQGSPANQVAILLPTDDAWAGFSPGKVSVTEAMKALVPAQLTAAILSAGYNYDFTDAETIARLGIHHSVLVFPPTDRIPIATLRNISAWADAGGKIIAVGRTPSMDAEGNGSREFTTLLHHIFNSTNTVADPSSIADALRRATPPDMAIAGAGVRDSIGFIRRRLPDADIYFIANTANRPITAQLQFTTKYASGSRWDPDTGAIANTVKPDNIALSLAPYESAVFIFSDQISTQPAPTVASSLLSDLSEQWSAHFTGIDKTIQLPRLVDWSRDPSTMHYSGEVVYTRSFANPAVQSGPVFLHIAGGKPEEEIPLRSTSQTPLGDDGLPDPSRTLTGPGMHSEYGPPIREAALVTINGQTAGTLWHPPYCIDISNLLRPGSNQIAIHVYNTALNAWSARPPRNDKLLIARYGDRFQMQDLDRVKPLPSGILGQAQLVSSCAE